MLPLVVGSASRRKQKFLQFSKSKPFGDITFTPLDLQSFEHDSGCRASDDIWCVSNWGGVGWYIAAEEKENEGHCVDPRQKPSKKIVPSSPSSNTIIYIWHIFKHSHACRNPQTQKLNHALGSESSRVSIFFVPQISVILMLPMGQT